MPFTRCLQRVSLSSEGLRFLVSKTEIIGVELLGDSKYKDRYGNKAGEMVNVLQKSHKEENYHEIISL